MSTVIFCDSQRVIQGPIQSLFSPRETIATHTMRSNQSFVCVGGKGSLRNHREFWKSTVKVSAFVVDILKKVMPNILTSVRILWKLSQAPAIVNFPRIARAQSFKPIWNVRAAFIGWKVSVKDACVKIHIVWHAIKIYEGHSVIFVPSLLKQELQHWSS